MPESLRLRLLSIRAFDDRVNTVDADVVHGREVETPIRAMLANDTVSDLHLHNARSGCYAARVDRA